MTPAALAIRGYRSTDRDAVIALFRDAMRELAPPAERAAFEAYIARAIDTELGHIDEYYGAREGCAFWVAERGGPIGIAGVERHSPEHAELRRMIVTAAQRRQGVARALLATAEAYCVEAGYTAIVLSTSELQSAAMALYRASGYVQLRSEIATTASHKRVGIGLRQYEFEKTLSLR